MDPFDVYEEDQSNDPDDPQVYNLCSKLREILQVFGRYNVSPILIGDVASGSYTDGSPLEFAANVPESQCYTISTDLQAVLGASCEIIVHNSQNRDLVDSLELSHYEEDPLQLSAELAHRRRVHLKHLENLDRQVVRVFALHDISPEKLEEVKQEMQEEFCIGPSIRAFATPDGYYALEGSHRLRAAYDLVKETGDEKYNPRLILYTATENIPHDITNLPTQISRVDEIVAIHNSGLFYEFEGHVQIFGHDD